MDIHQEIIVALIGIALSFLWMYLDWKLYLQLGMSPLFGSLKQEEYEDKINVFSIGVSIQIIVSMALVFGFLKFRGLINDGFSLKILSIAALSVAILGNLICRLILVIRLEKPKKDKFDL